MRLLRDAALGLAAVALVTVSQTAADAKAVVKVLPGAKGGTTRTVTLQGARDPSEWAILDRKAKPAPAPKSVTAPRRSAGAKAGPAAKGKPGLARTKAFSSSEQGEKRILPFTTARVDHGFPIKNNPAVTYAEPYRPVGRLVAQVGSRKTLCTGTLIRPGIVVTAAKCVASFGKNEVASAATFWPAAYGTDPAKQPYGVWNAVGFVVPSVFVDGTDKCADDYESAPPANGCDNDVALVVLERKFGVVTAGSVAGTIKASTTYTLDVAQVTVLGFAHNLDNGDRLIRTDALAYQKGKWDLGTDALQNRARPKTLAVGSIMGSGSTGAPWIVNFGNSADMISDPDLLVKAYAQLMIGITKSNAADRKYIDSCTGSVFGEFCYDHNDVYEDYKWVRYKNYEPEAWATRFGTTEQISGSYGVYGNGNLAFLLNQACNIRKAEFAVVDPC